MSPRPAPTARHARRHTDAPGTDVRSTGTPSSVPPFAFPDDHASLTEARIADLVEFGRSSPGALPLTVAFDATTGETSVLAVDDPVLDLRGVDAPMGADAVGIVAAGRAHPLADRAGTVPDRVGMALLVHRQGYVASRVWTHDDDAATPVLAAGADGASGLAVDVCRRMLGLPTAPPEVGTEALFTLLWLSVLLDRVEEVGPGTLSWPDLVAAHPARALALDVVDVALSAHEGDEAGCQPGPEPDPDAATPFATGRAVGVLLEVACRDDLHVDGLPECCEAVAQVFPWERVHAMAVRATEPLLGVDPDAAAWFDTGSFARAVLTGLVPGAVLLDRLDRLLPADLARAVRAVAEPQLGPPWAGW